MTYCLWSSVTVASPSVHRNMPVRLMCMARWDAVRRRGSSPVISTILILLSIMCFVVLFSYKITKKKLIDQFF